MRITLGTRRPSISPGAKRTFAKACAAVLEIYFAWPFQRPTVQGAWGFLVEEGW